MDEELFYSGSLLHDYGIVSPTAHRDFTLSSVDRLLSCAQAGGIADERAELLADGICVHATPGVTVERDGVLGYYIQGGAMVDAAGLRLWDITTRNVADTLRRYPQGCPETRHHSTGACGGGGVAPAAGSVCSCATDFRWPCGWHPSTQ